jgi:glutathione S-transferase
MIRLYGSPISRAQRVMWMLEELGVAYEQLPAGAPSNLGPTVSQNEVRRLYPSGKIPVLVDDDYAITESLAINLYLARKFSGEVSPATDEEWGRTFQWTSWVLDEVDKDIQKANVAALWRLQAEPPAARGSNRFRAAHGPRNGSRSSGA